MLIIPLVPTPSQAMTTSLAGQNCTITVRQKTTGVFLDLFVNGVLVVAGVICLDRVKLVRDLYLGFVGDLAFFDTQGVADPVYTGFGSRWILGYLETLDLGGLG